LICDTPSSRTTVLFAGWPLMLIAIALVGLLLPPD
jgi:hypothetical protein